MEGFPTLKGSWPWPWIGSSCMPSYITHRPLAACQISLKSKKLLPTDGRTDRHLNPCSGVFSIRTGTHQHAQFSQSAQDHSAAPIGVARGACGAQLPSPIVLKQKYERSVGLSEQLIYCLFFSIKDTGICHLLFFSQHGLYGSTSCCKSD